MLDPRFGSRSVALFLFVCVYVFPLKEKRTWEYHWPWTIFASLAKTREKRKQNKLSKIVNGEEKNSTWWSGVEARMLKIAVNVTTTTKEDEEEGKKERKRTNVVRIGYPLGEKQQQRKTGRKERQRAKREFKTNDNKNGWKKTEKTGWNNWRPGKQS